MRSLEHLVLNEVIRTVRQKRHVGQIEWLSGRDTRKQHKQRDHMVAFPHPRPSTPTPTRTTRDHPQSSTMDVFPGAIADIMKHWGVLQMAAKNEWGGADTREKMEWFYSIVVDKCTGADGWVRVDAGGCGRAAIYVV